MYLGVSCPFNAYLLADTKGKLPSSSQMIKSRHRRQHTYLGYKVKVTQYSPTSCLSELMVQLFLATFIMRRTINNMSVQTQCKPDMKKQTENIYVMLH